MKVIPFEAAHILSMTAQSSQEYLTDYVTEEVAEAMVSPLAFTGVIDGVPVASAGVMPVWRDRMIAWAFLSDQATGTNFLQVHRAVKRFLDGCTARRIEMSVDCEFAQGHRWARMLGFKLEAVRMRAYTPTGGDCALYARINQ